MERLAPAEARLLTVYRLLDRQDREALIRIAEAMLGGRTINAPRLGRWGDG